jgi:hypothetical protein
MVRFFSYAVTFLLASCLLSGCGVLYLTGYVATEATKNTYRSIVPESMTTVEEIHTADGQSIVVRVTSKYYLDRYVYSLESDGYPEWEFESESRVSSDGREMPIAFDVVKKTPWIVLPIKSNQCARFGFPRQGLVFFKLEGKSWRSVSYDQAPDNLKVNLLRNRRAYKEGMGMDMADCPFGVFHWNDGFVCNLNKEGAVYAAPETTHPIVKNYGRTLTPKYRQSLDAQVDARYRESRYIHDSGEGKTIKEIVDANLALPNIANQESCYYLNPPIDPDERRSINEYVNKPAVTVQASLVKFIDKEVEISDEQQQLFYKYPKTSGECAKLVKSNYSARIAEVNQAEFVNVAGVPSGTFKSPGTAVKVELNSTGDAHALYLPVKGFSMADRIDAMSCQADRVFISFGGGFREFQVMEYDLNAHLMNKWKIAYPAELKEGHRLAEFSVIKDRANFKLVDFESSGYNEGKKVSAKFYRQYFLEAIFPR